MKLKSTICLIPLLVALACNDNDSKEKTPNEEQNEDGKGNPDPGGNINLEPFAEDVSGISRDVYLSNGVAQTHITQFSMVKCQPIESEKHDTECIFTFTLDSAIPTNRDKFGDKMGNMSGNPIQISTTSNMLDWKENHDFDQRSKQPHTFDISFKFNAKIAGVDWRGYVLDLNIRHLDKKPTNINDYDTVTSKVTITLSE